MMSRSRRANLARRGRLVGALVAALVTVSGVAMAAWSADGTGSGSVASKMIPAGSTPTASVSAGNVTLSWTQTSLSNGGPAAGGYLVKRYNTSDVLQTIGSNCNTMVAGLTCTENSVPAGTWRYSVTPVLQGWTGIEGPKTEVIVINPPVVTASVIASSPGNGAGFVKQGGTYIVYANISGVVDTATANVTNVTSGSAAVALSACSTDCTVNGVTYAFKSGTLTASNPLAEGPKTYTVTASNAGGSHTANFSVTVDNTAPNVPDLPSSSDAHVILRNSSGGTEGVPENFDEIEIKFSEPLAVNTLCTGWTNNATAKNATVTVTITNGGNNSVDDIIGFSGASCGTFQLGTINMKGTFVTDGNLTFSGSAATWDPVAKTMVISLQNKVGTASVNQSSLVPAYNPNAAIRDQAGNQIGPGPFEGPNAKQF